MWRVALVVLAAACGRVGFDDVSRGGDSIVSTCAGTTIATLPPASGGGFALVRAYGDAPNAPASTPHTPTVELAWRTRGTLRHALVRGECGDALDIFTTQPCTPTTTGSCRVCLTTAATCRDPDAPASPSRVRYQVVVVDTNDSVVSQPDDADYIVDVAIPPPSMVLLHRASVNQEMCDLLGSPTDPTKHHRCAYTGPGGAPARAHPEGPDLGLPTGFYDFGYDLFVDRWEAGCNWTHEADGGACGAGDCVGNTAGPVGNVVGNVFYSTFNGRCNVRTQAGWQLVHDAATLDPASAALAYTNDPGPLHDRPPLGYLDVVDVAALCSRSTVIGYGAKRPLRLREFVAAGAFERMPLDPSPLAPAAIQQIEAGIAHPTTHACDVNLHDGVTPGGFRSGDELARDVTISPDPVEQADHFVIGSVATSRCVSRYGAQDLIGNITEVVSDTFAACGSGTPCVGTGSLVDAGNRDLVGFALDGSTGAGPMITSQPLENASKVLIPLAMPLAAGAPYGRAPDSAQLRGDPLNLYSEGNVRVRMGIVGGHNTAGMAAGRFWTDFGGDPNGANIDVGWGMRCAVAAVPR